MKFFLYLITISTLGLLLSGCQLPEKHERLTQFKMHGHDKITPAKPIPASGIYVSPARKPFQQVPLEIIDRYYKLLPQETRKYNLAMRQSSAGKTQDEITRTYILAIVDYELEKSKYSPNTQWIENGIKIFDKPMPEIKFVEEDRLFYTSKITSAQKRQFNILKHKYKNLQEIDAKITGFLQKCGVPENDRFWIKKWALLKYELRGAAQYMYEANEKMKEAL